MASTRFSSHSSYPTHPLFECVMDAFTTRIYQSFCSFVYPLKNY